MNYLTKIKITKDLRTLKKGLEINITKPFTAFVGDNGCGKSTLLDALRGALAVKTKLHGRDEFKLHIKIESKPDVPARFWDFHANDMKYAGFFLDDISTHLQAIRSSSGQGSVIQFMNQDIKDLENGIIILDEPCRGLSIPLQFKFLNLFSNLILKGNQLIISTHSKIFMDYAERAGQIYSLEHLKPFDKVQELMSEWLKIT